MTEESRSQANDDNRLRISIQPEDVEDTRPAEISLTPQLRDRQRISIQPKEENKLRLTSHDLGRNQYRNTRSDLLADASIDYSTTLLQLLRDFVHASHQHRASSQQINQDFEHRLAQHFESRQHKLNQIRNLQQHIQSLCERADQITKDVRAQVEQDDSLIEVNISNPEIEWTEQSLVENLIDVRDYMERQIERLEQLVHTYNREPISIPPKRRSLWQKAWDFVRDLTDH